MLLPLRSGGRSTHLRKSRTVEDVVRIGRILPIGIGIVKSQANSLAKSGGPKRSGPPNLTTQCYANDTSLSTVD